jgi:hypothetical protein
LASGKAIATEAYFELVRRLNAIESVHLDTAKIKDARISAICKSRGEDIKETDMKIKKLIIKGE